MRQVDFDDLEISNGDRVVVIGELVNWFYDRTPFEEVRVRITNASQVIKIDIGEQHQRQVYTREDIELCFEEARKSHSMIGWKYDNFEEFEKKCLSK
jgi:RecB family endonuclease NucS